MGMDHTWILHTESFGRKTVSSNYSKGDAYWIDKTTCFNSKACFKPCLGRKIIEKIDLVIIIRDS